MSCGSYVTYNLDYEIANLTVGERDKIIDFVSRIDTKTMDTVYKCTFYLYQASKDKPVPSIFDRTNCSLINTAYIVTYTDSIDLDKLFDMINVSLPTCLWRKHIKHFIPLQRPTISMRKDASGMDELVFIYYHNSDLHRDIFESHPTKVYMPIGELYKNLTVLLNEHGLDGWEDERARVIC